MFRDPLYNHVNCVAAAVCVLRSAQMCSRAPCAVVTMHEFPETLLATAAPQAQTACAGLPALHCSL